MAALLFEALLFEALLFEALLHQAMAGPLHYEIMLAGWLPQPSRPHERVNVGESWWSRPSRWRVAARTKAVGSWLGIRLASLWIGRIPDRIHAGVYLLLLMVVLAVMIIRH
ncbi:hypothetical protein [Halomonas huangheensis]|uniref:Uncharacterized protein n=1 Tax=Halomonas huangheensis TaxID=1178482 RepID=W1N2X9_9GAMM|nr:hypothetical protein [Halomonas huangheensis]ALM51472.1 hypothetical protein AR456_03550 [Halomonas huangheensis]ERL49927.1 hypothetical protein BJB45_02040 [Halomonas huangheensis]